MKALLVLLLMCPVLASDQGDTKDDRALAKALTLQASFDKAVRADVAGGGSTPSARFNHATEKGKFVFKKDFDGSVFRSAPGKGIHGGALEVKDILPNNGRIYFPARGNIAFKKGGWSGAVSFWINVDPNKQLKTPFCDPVQITEKGATNGGIWVDFNNAKPRDLRMGVFPAVAAGQKPISEDDPNAPMVRVKAVNFKQGDWHHIVATWTNFDTGKADGLAILYIDGQRQGAVKDRQLSMSWDLDKAGIYVAVNFIGLLDELSVFKRMLTPEEVSLLHRTPGLFSGRTK